jgi:hypothetical protein
MPRVNNLIAMVTMEHKKSKPTVEQGSPNRFNLNNFKIIGALGLELLHRGPLEWHYIRAKFHENLPSGSKVINRGLRQTDW